MEIAQSLEKKYSDRPAGCRGRVSVRVWGLRPKQGHSQKFATEGDKRRGLGPEVPHGCSGAEPRWGPGGEAQKPETNANFQLRRGGGHAPMSPLATPLLILFSSLNSQQFCFTL